MKKTRSFRVRPTAVHRRQPWHQSASSLMVLAGLGVLSFSLPNEALAQRAIAPNTLPVLRGVVSDRITVTPSTPAPGRAQLTIDQASLRGVIDWRSFDIGSSAEVLFRHQMGSQSSTLNRIYDARPSVIQGRLTSEGATAGSRGGQIILVNQNGILFGAGAQVNTQSLIASTLNISNQRFLSGALAGATPAFEGRYDDQGNTLPGGPTGSIVLTGAADGRAAPVLQAGQGGSIMIFAPSIDNQGGVIRAPDGQVVLAAGSKAYLAINPNESDTTLRGYVVEVEVPADGNVTSLIRNAGDVSADRGNVTLAALAVNQEGRITANTALQANGSIYLKAHTKNKAQSGSVRFQAGSVTEVTPDRNDTSTAPESQGYAPTASSPTEFRGVIDVQGRTIENHGTVRAAGGVIKLDASSSQGAEGARVYLAQGSQTSVAGTWSDVDFSKNLVTFTVTSNELKNSPDQKTGVLRGTEVTVDLRQDNGILDLSGYRGLVARTVAEKAAVGGDLLISSSGSVIQREGATLDASGGGYRYNGGMVGTTRLLGADGKVYDIGNAPQGLRYTQVLDTYRVTDPRWGQTVSYSNPLGMVRTYQPGYVEGKSGGAVTISAQSGVVLDGTLRGGVTVGARQARNAPRGATLRIGDYSSSHRLINERQNIGSITLTQHASDSLGAAFHVGSELSGGQRRGFTLGADQVFGASTQTADGRVESGFGAVELNSNGRILMGEGVSLRSDPGAELTLRAQAIDIAGNIRLAGGKLVLHAAEAAAPLAEVADNTSHNITVRSGATLATAGEWLNASSSDGRVPPLVPTGRAAANGTAVSTLNGGSITLEMDKSIYHSTLERGSVLDVSGGASLSASQRVTAGDGGKLTIANGSVGQTNPDWMQAELRGFSLGKGGELNLKLGEALIVPEGTTGTVPAATTRLDAGLFADHGFSKVGIEAAGGITITAGTTIEAVQHNRVLDTASARRLATGGDLASVASVQRLPDGQRGSMTVSLNARGDAPGPTAGELSVGAGASVTTDPKGEIALTARHALEVDGRLGAAGGKISLTVSGPDSQGALATGRLHLGAQADVSVRGTFVATPNERGLVQGTLHDGGTITLEARRAGVQVDAGARLDVGGVSQVVDLAQPGRTPTFVKQTIEGHAGTLVVKSQGATVLDGTLLGHGGSNAAAGGSFALELTRPDRQAEMPAERRIVVTPGNGPVQPADVDTADARVDVRALTAGGFDKLRLQSENRIEFQQSVNVDFKRGVRLDAPQVELADGARVIVTGSTVSLGQSMGPRVAEELDGVDEYNLKPLGVSPAVTTRSGTGELMVRGGMVNVYGDLTVNGAQRTRIESDGDVQLVGRSVSFESGTAGGQAVTRQVGSLTTAGNVEIQASQIYPATRTEFGIAVKDTATGTPVADGRITISGNGRTAGDVYSAGGQLTLQAQDIHQGGTVKAPLGQIAMNAGRSLTLSTGSTTSVSGNGLTVLYGGTDSGTQWRYDDGSGNQTLTSVTDQGKTMTLNAPMLDVQAGATVNLSGGGDVRAVEFVKGNGGDNDITTAANTYAIIPASQLQAMPYDRHTLAVSDPGLGFSLANGRDGVRFDSIVIERGAGIPAGEYVLLSARYALLPNAYLVELQTGSAYRNLQSQQDLRMLNGDKVITARRSASGSDLQESQTIGVVIRPGLAAAQRASDYNLTGAGFFADAAERERMAAPPSPWDAGRLLIDNASDVRLRGSFNTAAGNSPANTAGRVADIDISANRIAVVDQVSSATEWQGYLQLEGQQLSGLNGNVLLGGKRTHTDAGQKITASAVDSQVVVANSRDGAVNLREITLVAGDSIDVRVGSVLNAAGTPAQSPGVITADASGALLRLSSGEQARLDRGEASAARGSVRIAEGATLTSSKSMLIDATQSTESSGTLRVGGDNGAGGALSLSSGQVTLGDVAPGAVTSGLVLSTGQLANYRALDELVLRGYGAIDLVGATTLGSSDLKSLTLDTPLLRGRVGAQGEAAQATLSARTLTLANNSEAVAPAQTGAGTLNATADRLVLADGAKGLGGFGDVALTARDTIALEGRGGLDSAARTTLQAPRVLVAGGAQQRVSAVDARLALSAGSGTAAVPTNETELGGRLALEGRHVDVATTVQARSGQIDVWAAGGTITLAQGALLDARGQAKDFNGTIVTADGGGVSLNAAQVDLQAGARLDVSAAAQGGGAGRLAIKTDTVNLTGDLAGRAAAGARSGSVSLDLGALGATTFSAVNDRLNAGGFAEERQLRLRTGDLDVAAGDHVAARRVTLSADTGRIDVSGTVGTGAAQGGAQINLFAHGGISLGAGSQLRAGASEAGARGGEVRVATSGGALVFDRDAVIDVSAGQSGSAGSVNFGVSRDDQNLVGSATLQGTVRRRGGSTAASVDLEATRVYNVAGDVTSSDIDRFAQDHQNFITGTTQAPVAGLRDESGAVSDARVLGATELRSARSDTSSGDITLGSNWNLRDERWLADGRPGTLTVRAEGNLTVSASVGSVDDNIIAGDTWSLRLAGGADLSAANPLAVRPLNALPADNGSLLLSGANAKLRTGTGRIALAAGRDIRIDNVDATIYTAGRTGVDDATSRWSVDGGSITLLAGGSITGASQQGSLWVNDWLRKRRMTQLAFQGREATDTLPGVEPAPNTDWWTYRARFRQAVGTLGGGDVSITAGGDMRHLDVMLPTSGRSSLEGGSLSVDVQGGGHLDVKVAGDIVSGAFLIGRGTGRLEAGGDIRPHHVTSDEGATVDRNPIQLNLMGVSSGAVPELASIDLVAGGSISLQGVFNPTSQAMTGRVTGEAPASDPSFANAGNFHSFFTYSANSFAGLTSKGGDIGYAYGATGATWRKAGQASPFTDATVGAYPASLSFTAFDGDINGPDQTAALTTYPSRSARVALLAGGTLRNVSLYGSDLDPALLPTATTGYARQRATAISSGELRAPGTGSRIVSRDPVGPYVFELQALEGDVLANAEDTITLTAAGRVIAGRDLVSAGFNLQNLNDSDVSVVRAVGGDIRAVTGLQIGGPGRLVLQAGRNIDLGPAVVPGGGTNDGLGGVVATGNTFNPNLAAAGSARVTLVAGVSGNVDLAKMDQAYAEIKALNKASSDIMDLYQQLLTEPDVRKILDATSVSQLARQDAVYARFAELDGLAPRAFAAYQQALRAGSLPLSSADGASVARLYGLLNQEGDLSRLREAGSVAALAERPGGQAYREFVGLEQRFGVVFTDYLRRRGEGALPTSVTPMVFSHALAHVVSDVVPASPAGATGSIYGYQTSIQTYAGSGIDLWAPNGGAVVGLQTPSEGRAIGVLTNAGGAIQSVVAGDFNINQGKVITAQGGDILLFSSQGSIDAGRGARTSVTTPPPRREVINDSAGNPIGVKLVVSNAAAGSGIQTLTSDPDGLGPLPSPKAGDVYLFAPAGTIDAGEAGIRSSGNITVVAPRVDNGDNISAKGDRQGVPQAATGSQAASIASAGGTGDGGAKAVQEAAKNAAEAARAATGAGVPKPSILTVEVLGFGDKNCKETERDCFAK
ncbi:filamentous haemagglutinin family protein [Piscinibacter sp. HJYY11]|uniref:filamentous haemagglutinin family protein n=1 Tax=Piscinibacter sp. HJYY11 TaxID=2801333 RepID=UPI00191E422D|nr:filamentous haemagglutinin family protein [Piscinibacter sp. HJYY11]MBL0726186.1 filamentous hemagglutinin family protein [Piscinibacter sp. HJYY11]